jgi:hypothetical protein
MRNKPKVVRDKSKSLQTRHNAQVQKQIGNDIKLNMEHGKPRKQAIAIALNKAGKKRK